MKRKDKPRKAPKVAPPPKDKPNYMRESDKLPITGTPMKKKKLAK